MIEVGRVFIKTQGRDANKVGVVIEVIDKNYVLVDGNVRRKKVNKVHIEPLNKVLKVSKKDDTKTILALFEKEGLKVSKNSETKKKTNPKPQVKKDTSKKVENKKK